MPFLAGQIIEADRLNNLQPKTYQAGITGSFIGPQTGQDVPGVTVTFDTATDNATAKIEFTGDFRVTVLDGASDELGSVRPFIDGVATTVFALFKSDTGAVGSYSTTSNTVTVGLGTAGTHTIKLNGTVPTGMLLSSYTNMVVTVYEVA